MTITIDADLIALAVIGLMAGTLAAMLFERGQQAQEKWVRNLAIGIVGAFLGSLLFDALNLKDDIPDILTGAITMADIAVAFVGASILMSVAGAIRR